MLFSQRLAPRCFLIPATAYRKLILSAIRTYTQNLVLYFFLRFSILIFIERKLFYINFQVSIFWVKLLPLQNIHVAINDQYFIFPIFTHKEYLFENMWTLLRCLSLRRDADPKLDGQPGTRGVALADSSSFGPRKSKNYPTNLWRGLGFN